MCVSLGRRKFARAENNVCAVDAVIGLTFFKISRVLNESLIRTLDPFFFFFAIIQMPACFLNQFKQQMKAEVYIWMF